MEMIAISSEDTAEALLLAACYRIARERARLVKHELGNGETPAAEPAQIGGGHPVEQHETGRIAEGSEIARK